MWLGALGQATDKVVLQTSVLTPTMRYDPAVVAQSFATLGALNPGRVVLGVGSGEALNETPATGAPWPKFKERSARLAESVELIRQLFNGERVSFAGEYYRTENATIYDKPEQPVPIYIAAGGPKAATLVGRIGDGFICTSGKGEDLYHTLLGGVGEGAEAAGKDPAQIVKNIEIKVSYDQDAAWAKDACRPWAALALTAEEKGGTEDPIEMERLAEGAVDRAHNRFIVSDDPEEVVEKIAWYVDLGFEELVFHFPRRRSAPPDRRVRRRHPAAAAPAPELTRPRRERKTRGCAHSSYARENPSRDAAASPTRTGAHCPDLAGARHEPE